MEDGMSLILDSIMSHNSRNLRKTYGSKWLFHNKECEYAV